jgi:choline dehydrogenase-like flavoprotein
MGTSLATSVTDPDGQVHGVANLFVSGGSLFPTSGYANPTLTIIALALRQSEHLARTLGIEVT